MSTALPELSVLREHLYTAVVCDALDALGLRRQSPAVALPPLTCDRVVLGRCRTTLWVEMADDDPDPYALELKAVDACRSDEVFVAAAAGSMRSGIWGELLTTAVINGGCVGAVVDGAVRDVAKIRSLDFPVYARGVCPYDSLHRQRVVDLDVTVEIGGVNCSPGDLLIADQDGLAVIPQTVESDALRLAWEKVHAENEVRDAIRNGMKATDAFAKYGVL